MVPQQIANWVMPALLGVVIAGIGALLRMSSTQQRQGDVQARQDEDISDIRKRLDGHDDRLQRQDITLARIDEGVEWIKRTLGKAFEGSAKQ